MRGRETYHLIVYVEVYQSEHVNNKFNLKLLGGMQCSYSVNTCTRLHISTCCLYAYIVIEIGERFVIKIWSTSSRKSTVCVCVGPSEMLKV